MRYQERITIDSTIMLGKPVITGTRITVELILSKIAGGYTFDEILDMYPHLVHNDLLSAVSYAVSLLKNEEALYSE